MGKSLREKTFEALKQSRELGLGYLNTVSDFFDGNIVESEKGKMTIFGLCDYLKIMPDKRIKEAAVNAVNKIGINFAVSRAYMKLHTYEKAEQMLSQVFGKPVLLFSRAALAHIGTMSAVIEPHDIIFLDQQVHSTLQTGAAVLGAKGAKVFFIRHNRMDQLEGYLEEFRDYPHKMWYLADGIYSMYGDPFPAQKIKELLEKHKNLHLYIDDAHGLSWTGKNGTGYVLEHLGHHPKMMLVSSLGKGFGAGGGLVVCPDEDARERVLYSGSPLMFSSPIEPSMQGAVIASSKIHMSDEITEKQKRISELMDYFYKGIEERELPVINADKTPIGYFPTGDNDAIFTIMGFLQENGILTTAGVHPAVGINNTGVRVQIALYQTEDDIDRLLDLIKEGYRILEEKQGKSVEKIMKYFKH